MNEAEYNLISEILTLPNVKSNLISIFLKLNALDSALMILDSCSNLQEIDEIDLRYNSTNLSNKDCQSHIKEAIRQFTIKVGLIKKLVVKK